MAENDSDREQEHYEAPPPPVKKKKRGPSKLSKVVALIVKHKKKNHLELNEKNRPIGPTAKPFASYLGTVARNRLDITINEWKRNTLMTMLSNSVGWMYWYAHIN